MASSFDWFINGNLATSLDPCAGLLICFTLAFNNARRWVLAGRCCQSNRLQVHWEMYSLLLKDEALKGNHCQACLGMDGHFYWRKTSPGWNDVISTCIYTALPLACTFQFITLIWTVFITMQRYGIISWYIQSELLFLATINYALNESSSVIAY